jgi:hypothetical protein
LNTTPIYTPLPGSLARRLINHLRVQRNGFQMTNSDIERTFGADLLSISGQLSEAKNAGALKFVFNDEDGCYVWTLGRYGHSDRIKVQDAEFVAQSNELIDLEKEPLDVVVKPSPEQVHPWRAPTNVFPNVAPSTQRVRTPDAVVDLKTIVVRKGVKLRTGKGDVDREFDVFLKGFKIGDSALYPAEWRHQIGRQASRYAQASGSKFTFSPMPDGQHGIERTQ